MTWHRDGTLISWDLETTGLNVESDRIVTASRWIIRPAEDYKQHTGWIVDPGIEIPESATGIHGVTTEKARADGQQAATAVREIAGDLVTCAVEAKNPVFVAFNASYDTTLLHRECLRYGYVDLAEKVAALRPFFDPLVVDKAVEKYRKGSRKLVDVAAHYRVPLSEEDAHGSAADSLAAARVAYVIAERYPHIGQTEPDELHAAQIGWAAEQARSLAEYFDRKGQKHDVRPEWPIVPAT